MMIYDRAIKHVNASRGNKKEKKEKKVEQNRPAKDR